MPGIGLTSRPKGCICQESEAASVFSLCAMGQLAAVQGVNRGPEAWPGKGQYQLSVCVLPLSKQPAAPQASSLEASLCCHVLRGEVLGPNRTTSLLSGQLRPRLYLWLDLAHRLCADPEVGITTRIQRRNSRGDFTHQ